MSLVYCRRCCQRANRHGCHWKRTYSAAVLDPYRKAAERFLKTHPNDIWVVAAVHALDCLMADSGPVERIVDVNELLDPPAKARAALARLRRAGIAPRRLLVNYLAVCAAIAEDPVSPGSEATEYRRVQAAKAVFRLASGSHVVYAPGSRYDRYPRSAGLALRHLGLMLEEACEHVREAHLPAVLGLKSALALSTQGGHDAATA